MKAFVAIWTKFADAVKAVLFSPWFPWVGLVLVLLLLGYLVYRIIQRKKQDRPEPAPDLPEAPEPMGPNALLSLWKAYVKKIPGEFRRTILLYRPFVVLGAAGTGKSSLIDTYSDWKNQSDQFYPSHTENQDLQIYQGSRVIIQELSPAVLENTTNEARKALVKLWKPFKRREDITAVATISWEDLVNENQESLISQAQIIRGKLNILSQVMKKPVPVHVAVTGMDRLTGFAPYARFSAKKGFCTHIDCGPDADGIDPAELTSEIYEKHLSHFLVTESSRDYLALLAFFNRQPALYAGMAKFIRVLAKPDPLADAPEIRTVYFTSTAVPGRDLSNPFKPEEEQPEKARRRHPDFRHRAAALTLLALGCLYLGYSHSYKDRYVEEVKVQVAHIQQLIHAGSDHTALLEDLLKKTYAIEGHGMLAVLVDFHPEAKHEILEVVLAYVRNQVLVEALDKLRDGGDNHEKVLMMLALIYGSRSNQLGRIILENPGEWAAATGFSEKFIKEYIELSETSWKKVVSLKGLVYEKPVSSRGHHQLKVFINSLQDVSRGGYLSEESFLGLQATGAVILDRVRAEAEAGEGLQAGLIPLLNKETVLFLPTLGKKADNRNRNQGLADFLYEFQDLVYDYPDPEELSLQACFNQLTAMLDFKPTRIDRLLVELSGREYWLDLGRFQEIVHTSGVISFIRTYISKYSYPPGLSFFTPGRQYQDLNAAMSTGSDFFFTAKKIIDGRYTKQTFDDAVKPPLDQFPELLDKLPLSPAEKQRFSGFVYREVEAYSEKYAGEYTDYFSKFSMQADSMGELRFILNQILLPVSQFQEFMLTLSTNLDLAYGDNDYYKPMRMNLSTLGFMNVIMQNQKDFFPELEKYKAILRMMLTDLETDGATLPPNPTDETDALKRSLSPAARITLAIFRNDDGSYLNLVRKWAAGMGVPDHMAYTFLEPVYQVYRLGLAELDSQVATRWNEIKARHLGPDLDRFPFNRNASSDADPVNILKLMKKDTEFWTQFNQFIAPLCRRVNGQWQAREFEMGSISLPAGLLDTVNHLEYLSGLLVDGNNAPKPLLAEVKADILPRIENRLQYVILTYLQSDSSSVYGFNQRPAWTTFKINWWKQSQSSIGVEFTEGENSESKTYRTDTIPNSFWSFYKLLQKAEVEPGKKAWTWQVDSPENLNWKRSVTFFIKQDPFAIFTADRTQ